MTAPASPPVAVGVDAVLVPKTITFRLSAELRQALEAEVAALAPYSPTLTTVMERGVTLALAEMRILRTKHGEGDQ